MAVRLDKILANTGRSRSEATRLIRSGCVAVDGTTVFSGALKLEPEVSVISVNDCVISYSRFCYLMMNKPPGFISATQDEKEQTVTVLLDEGYKKLGLFPAGRLDKDARGLLILTNDGDFAHRITAPIKKVWKTYYVETDCAFETEDEKKFSEGIVLSDGTKCKPAYLRIGEGGKDGYVMVCEGKYHQVKRMCAAIGRRVLYLRRAAIGGLTLDEGLAEGDYRVLTDDEVLACQKSAKMP